MDFVSLLPALSIAFPGRKNWACGRGDLWSLPRHPLLQAAVLAAGAAGRRQQGCLCVGGGVYQAACASAAAAADTAGTAAIDAL